MRRSRNLDGYFARLMTGLAMFILIEPLALLAIVVTASRYPDGLWWVLGAYLVVNAVLVVAVVFFLRRWGLLNLGPVRTPLLVAVGAITLLTVLYIAIVAVVPELGGVWTIAYLVAIAGTIFGIVRWQVRNLAFRCDTCGHVFTASASSWLLSLNMGSYKRVACPNCGAHWAEVVRS